MKTIISNVIEKIDNKIVQSKDYLHIPNAEIQLLYIDIKTYKKKDLILPSGTIIKHGNFVGEIHVDNNKIKNMNLGLKTTVAILRDELDSLSIAVLNDSRFSSITAFYGRTILYSLLKRENFTILDLDRNIKVIVVEIWTKLLRLIYSNNNISNNNRKVKEFWITREELLKRKML